MSHLLAHGESRGGLGNGQRLLRYANGRPITKKRYEYLWRRLGEHLAWIETLQVSMYWIRHTILTWVERRGVASDATFRHRREDDGAGDPAGAL
jgi:integrase/recombinase XerC